MTYSSTREVATILKVNPSRLSRAVWDGRVDPPQKSPSGNFLWTYEDINRASWALLHKAFEPADAEAAMANKPIYQRTVGVLHDLQAQAEISSTHWDHPAI